MIVETVADMNETKTNESLSEEARSLLARGKKHFLHKDFEESLNCLDQACAEFAQIYGETAQECADAYHIYGKVLLEVARQETGVLGDAIAGEDEDDEDDDESDNEESQNDDKNVAEPENCESTETMSVSDPEEKTLEKKDVKIRENGESTETMSVSDPDENIPDKEDVKIAESAEKMVTNSKENSPEKKDVKIAESAEKMVTNSKENSPEKKETELGEESEKSDCKDNAMNEEPKDIALNEEEKAGDLDETTQDEDELTNLKRAWEMLELAKCILEKHSKDKVEKLKLADIYLHLGLVGLESETYDQAISDILQCLKIQKEHADDDRLIAETYFNLGMAYALNSEISNSKDAYSKCLNILLLKCESLEKKHAEENISENISDVVKNELKELKSLIPEVQEKIKEIDDVKEESIKFARKLLDSECFRAKGESSKTNGDENKEEKVVSNISHLVRKKRKADEDASETNSKDETDVETVPAKVKKTE